VIGAHWIPELQEFHHGQRIVGELQHDIDVPMIQRVRKMSADFYKASSAENFSTDWISIATDECHADDVLVEYSRCCDLVIAPASSKDQGSHVLLSELILKSGKPVLVIPNYYAQELEVDRALIAWNCSRESARAAFDALPLLKKASQSEILWIEEAENPDDIVHFRIKEFTTSLVLHSVEPIIDRIQTPERSDSTISQLILSRAAQTGSGLIVAGAKAKPIAEKELLGSTTSELILTSPVPILFSC
jgi:nucleotide-binding universal stress UspA family protein